MDESTREPFLVRCGDTTRRDWRNLMRVMWTLGVWAVCFAGGSQLIKRGLLPEGPISWLVAALATVAGLFVILAYGRFLSQADELQRLIQLQALALGFGGTFFAIAGYRMFERLGAPPADLGDFTMVMAILYSLGSVLGWKRYR
ncbi:MAG: hypothetical protein AAF657_23830 [Acidobacteriota bacterium]